MRTQPQGDRRHTRQVGGRASCGARGVPAHRCAVAGHAAAGQAAEGIDESSLRFLAASALAARRKEEEEEKVEAQRQAADAMERARLLLEQAGKRRKRKKRRKKTLPPTSSPRSSRFTR